MRRTTKFLSSVFLILSCNLLVGATNPKPIYGIYLEKSCFTIQYDTRTRNAAYVHERILSRRDIQVLSRNNQKFREDKKIPQIFRGVSEDFSKSGFDKGHMACAANHKDDENDYRDTFLLSNVCPQHPKLNRVAWLSLENHVREIVESSIVTDIYTGALFLPYEECGKRWVKYEVIGEHNIAVPTHFFKVVRSTKADGSLDDQAFILPNDELPSGVTFKDYATTIEKVESVSGILFGSRPM